MHDSRLEDQDMNKIRIIHARTQDQYNSWMKKLEDEGYIWNGRVAHINIDEFGEPDTKFVIELEIDDKTLSYGYRGYYTKDHKENDPVNHPSHYNQGGIETLDIIKMCLTEEEYKGYLKGNVIKYRERAQFKGNAEQDYAKAKFYFDELEVTK